jgi:hypothetical protein
VTRVTVRRVRNLVLTVVPARTAPVAAVAAQPPAAHAPPLPYRLHVAWVGYRIHGEWFRDETRLIELARRAQREQIAAFKRGDDETDILAMPVDRITPTARVRANLLVSL